MIQREISSHLINSIRNLPVLTLTGPRQSGKSTLVKSLFTKHDYVNLENIEMREAATEDPVGFLNMFKKQLIIDEAQYAPSLFSYIQLMADEYPDHSQYILTGSQNFLLMEKISQTMAGRTAIYHLLPFSITELTETDITMDNFHTWILNGFYPRIIDKKLEAISWLRDYIRTYVERDVRTLINIGDLRNFRKFISLCAGRIGQSVNLTSLGNDIGVSYQTIKSWISVLETSFILYLLPPYYNSFNKRITKSPKMYFYDTGLAAYLLGIRSKKELQLHSSKGALFENLCIMELVKQKNNQNLHLDLYYWRDNSGREVDCLFEYKGTLHAVEIKSSQTFHKDFISNLVYFEKISGKNPKMKVIYGGNTQQQRKDIRILPWSASVKVFE